MIQAGNVYSIFEEQAVRILSEEVDDKEMIPASDQEEKLQLYKRTLHFEQFFFVIDNCSFQADWVCGIYHLLGYADKTFTLEKFFNLIHPTHNMVQLINRYELLETLLRGERIIRFSSPVFVANIALKHASGEYLLFKWLASPFQINSKNALLSYLNEFTLISPFNNEICNLRVIGKNGKPVDWYGELSANIKRRLRDQALFSKKELLILVHYSLNPSSTNAAVADCFNIKISSVITYNKRILRKAAKMFMRHFKTAHDVADYLFTEHLI